MQAGCCPVVYASCFQGLPEPSLLAQGCGRVDDKLVGGGVKGGHCLHLHRIVACGNREQSTKSSGQAGSMLSACGRLRRPAVASSRSAWQRGSGMHTCARNEQFRSAGTHRKK